MWCLLPPTNQNLIVFRILDIFNHIVNKIYIHNLKIDNHTYLAYSFTKVSMSNLEPKFRFKDVRFQDPVWWVWICDNRWPWHLLQSIIGDGESLRQVEGKCLLSIGKDVEGNLRSFSLKIGDKLLKMCCSIHCNLKYIQKEINFL